LFLKGVEKSLMPVMYDADVDADGRAVDGRPQPRRRARHLEQRRRRRRLVAAGLAAVGVIAIVAGLSWQPGTENTAKPPTTGPGGVGVEPEKTGLPAKAATGGRVRTGTREEGCFANMREYLDTWDRTGEEPDPCFIAQEPASQPQPDGVVRSYNGEKF
jgi:hypothetical protein